MKFFYYIKYFLFIAFNWNPRLAWFTLYHEIKGEKKYGINTTGLNNLSDQTIKGNLEEAEIYQGTNYFLLEKLFEKLRTLNANHSLVDFGSGKGRVLAVAAFFGFKKLTGVEFAQELASESRILLSKFKKKFPTEEFHIIHENAAEYKINMDDEVFFFFNPFNEKIMLSVVKNILRSLKTNPRKIFVVYVNPLHKEIFLSAGFEEIYFYQKLYYVQASILTYE